MPVLTNERHEQFAKYLSQGLSEYDAHIKAGYTGHKPAIRALTQRPDIRQRVAELIKEQEDNLANEECEIPEALLEDEQISVTRTWLLKQLTDNVLKSKRAGQYSASNKAIEMLGNFLGGMFNAKQGGTGTAAELGHPPLTSQQSFQALIDFAKNTMGPDNEPEPVTKKPAMKDITPDDGTPKRRGRPTTKIAPEYPSVLGRRPNKPIDIDPEDNQEED